MNTKMRCGHPFVSLRSGKSEARVAQAGTTHGGTAAFRPQLNMYLKSAAIGVLRAFRARMAAGLFLIAAAAGAWADVPSTNAPAVVPVVVPAPKPAAVPASVPAAVPAAEPTAPPDRPARDFPPGRRPPLRRFAPSVRTLGAGPSTNHVDKPTAGFTYTHEELSEGPWSVHVFKATRGRPGLEIDTTLGGGDTIGMAGVSEQMKTIPPELGRPLAAVNGDFFDHSRLYPGDPEGLQIIHGELVSAPYPTRVCMWVDAANNLHRTNVQSHFCVTWPNGTNTGFGLNEARPDDSVVLYTSAIGTSTRTYGGRELVLEQNGTNAWLPLRIGQTYSARVRSVREAGNTPVNKDVMVLSIGSDFFSQVQKVTTGAVVRVSTATLPDLTGAKAGIGGGPTLVQGGKAKEWGLFQARHPRTAVGWNKEFIYLVEVDGRQSGSIGMSYSELANYFVKLGCDEALNLDGGGSATLWAYGNTMNTPSQGYERPSANTLVLLLKKQPEK